MFSASAFFDLAEFEHRALFDGDAPVWTALDRLSGYLAALFEGDWALKGFVGLVQEPLVILNGEVVLEGNIALVPTKKGSVTVHIDDEPKPEAAVIQAGAYLFDDRVIIGPGTVVESGALIKGPTVIGARAEVRQGAYFRGDCLVGDEALVGHATEIKNSIMLNGAKAGHFAYLGDSILGRGVNLGAGTKLANLKITPGSVRVRTPDGERHDTGRRKLGAILGDGCETGCNAVTSPGTLLGPSSWIMPCVNPPSGLYPKRSVISFAESAVSVRTPGS